MSEPSIPDSAVHDGQAGPAWDEGESYLTGSKAKRERMAVYVDWLLTPPNERDPSTKTALAELLGVSPQTLRNYEREPFVQREMAERARAGFKMLRLPDVIHHLSEIALGKQGRYPGKESPSAAVSAAKTLLEWADKTSDLREDKINLEDLTEQELVSVALEILQAQNAD